MTTSPIIHKITRTNGVAGQVQVTASVEYPQEDIRQVTFVGSVYGGPVVMVTEEGRQTFVTAPERFGSFGKDWVRSFFSAS